MRAKSSRTAHVPGMSIQTTPQTASDLLTTEEAAALIRTPVRTLENWRLRGGGPRYVKFSRRLFYKRSSLDAFIDGHEVSE